MLDSRFFPETKASYIQRSSLELHWAIAVVVALQYQAGVILSPTIFVVTNRAVGVWV